MAKLPSQDDAALAFAQVFTVVEFLRKEFGAEAVPNILRLAGEGLSVEQALLRVTKLDILGIERAWQRYIVKRPFKNTHDVKATTLRFLDEAKEQDKLPKDATSDRDVYKYMRLGELLSLRNHSQAALLVYEKAYAQAGTGNVELADQLARAYVRLKAQKDALRVLEDALKHDKGTSDSADARMLAGRLYLEQNNFSKAKTHFYRVRLQNPFNPEMHLGLAKIFQEQGDDSTAATEKHFGQLSLQKRPQRQFELKATSKPDTRMTIVSAPWGPVKIGDQIIESPYWNFPLQAGRHTLHYEQASGNSATAVFELQKGESKILRLR